MAIGNVNIVMVIANCRCDNAGKWTYLRARHDAFISVTVETFFLSSDNEHFHRFYWSIAKGSGATNRVPLNSRLSNGDRQMTSRFINGRFLIKRAKGERGENQMRDHKRARSCAVHGDGWQIRLCRYSFQIRSRCYRKGYVSRVSSRRSIR